ncbi:hypothetical protein [Niabella drilacis]|uniref:Secreted protein n=1 Tax=Niabella drilacis (strain DSM 25811 / CCM 8410 / CCUG 62505 / LMG 26954 / E90) TaxID=1285928 RepID=A0A1G6W6G4_NIADE|nr:hypothetical protein [Niabella drilacis]SDD61388.1 hypothetical protein SAMN04487894_11119 [Niabella drilacis]
MNHHSHPAPVTDVQMHLLTAPEAISAGTEIQLSLKPVRHTDPGAVVILTQQHGAPFHLIVLDEALTWFRHLHPVLQPDGSYQVRLTFPAGGNYLLYADYQPEGTPSLVDKILLPVAGDRPGPVAVTGQKLTAVTGDLDIRIDLAAPLYTGTSTLLPFRIERNGKPLKTTALSPYLGAIAHLILIHGEDKDFLHIHPRSGTDAPVVAHTTFEKAGRYRLWIQFKTGDELHTAAFTLDVKAAMPAAPVQHVHHHG